MKKIRFDKLVSLVVEPKEEETTVVVNGVKFIYEDEKLNEERDTITVKQAKEIEAKYEPIINEEGNEIYSDEDIEAIQKEVKEYKVKEPVELIVDKKNVIEKVKELLK
jgi:hypothetical protein